jgi:hypothetical protein
LSILSGLTLLHLSGLSVLLSSTYFSWYHPTTAFISRLPISTSDRPGENGHSHGNDDAKVYPVLQSTREDDCNLHDVQDRSAKVRDKLEDLVLLWAAPLAPARDYSAHLAG